MTRLDVGPESAVVHADEPTPTTDGPRALLLEFRAVPLGGVRGMEVHRALPQRDLPMVGAWCFLDRFGPQRTRMRVEPHPHIGLQTVTWPFVGEVHHRDSVGSDVVISRGALNIMTSGAGIAHSEYSVGEEAIPLDALQLWVALPESRRAGAPDFERHDDLPRVTLVADQGETGEAIVVLGEFGGATSPATAYTPIVGAELRIPAGSRVHLPLHPDWEYALAGVEGAASLSLPEATLIDPEHLLYLGTGREDLVIGGDTDTVVFLLGGEPFEDDIVMWWNFVGRTHEEIVDARDAWEQGSPRFGHVVGHGDERIPAPPLPGVRLTQRRRRV
ncbi:pirin family protein [Microbacterium rhizomatis]|uniref:Pirin family protein n=1 Tax=Microbacterium rhizomatis TaxID=1631477 RepID=A0A5J5IXR4_9MICO|nr:pirin family protein [Microbacterium rhizomatis]KAA9106442.1 pirin family protein [Microbacterium rhizomatis]